MEWLIEWVLNKKDQPTIMIKVKIVVVIVIVMVMKVELPVTPLYRSPCLSVGQSV